MVAFEMFGAWRTFEGNFEEGCCRITGGEAFRVQTQLRIIVDN